MRTCCTHVAWHVVKAITKSLFAFCFIHDLFPVKLCDCWFADGWARDLLFTKLCVTADLRLDEPCRVNVTRPAPLPVRLLLALFFLALVGLVTALPILAVRLAVLPVLTLTILTLLLRLPLRATRIVCGRLL